MTDSKMLTVLQSPKKSSGSESMWNRFRKNPEELRKSSGRIPRQRGSSSSSFVAESRKVNKSSCSYPRDVCGSRKPEGSQKDSTRARVFTPPFPLLLLFVFSFFHLFFTLHNFNLFVNSLISWLGYVIVNQLPIGHDYFHTSIRY